MFTQKFCFVGLTAIIAAILVLGLPAYAQQRSDSAATSGESTDKWSSEKLERQQFREEMQQIRKEHEDLEHDSETLLDKCVNIQDQQKVDSCQDEKQALHERRTKLHERTRVLHEKMEAARQEEAARTAQMRDDYHSFHSEVISPETGSASMPSASALFVPSSK